MGKQIILARPLPGDIVIGHRARSMGDSCEFIRDQVDSAQHKITFVKFADGERRVLVDKDIASDESASVNPVEANRKSADCLAIWDDWDGELGGECG